VSLVRACFFDFWPRSSIIQAPLGYLSCSSSQDEKMSLSTTASLEPTLDAAERKRKAAAAARRRRRKALAARYRKRKLEQKEREQRQTNEEQSPRSVSQPRVFLGSPLSCLSREDEEEDIDEKEHSLQPTMSEGSDDANSSSDSSSNPNASSSSSGEERSSKKDVYTTPIWPRNSESDHSAPGPPVSLDVSDTNSSISSTATKRIEATVHGLSQVGHLWKQQDIVAIPTECTYEACLALKASSLSVPSSEVELNLENNPSSNSSAQDWAFRIQQLRQVVGTASDAIHHMAASSSTFAPYCYVPRNAVCPWLQECLPPRAYALRDANTTGNSNSTKGKHHHQQHQRTGRQLVHKFNEVHEVLQRLARHVWPGPVTMHVAVPCTTHQGSATTTTTGSNKFQRFWSQLMTITTTPCPQHDSEHEENASSGRFLTLRCPRHPLAIKATQQHHVATTPRGSNKLPHRLGSNGQPTPTSSSPKRESIPLSILVGFPVAGPQQPQKQDVTASFCCTSKQVQQLAPSGTRKISAVLDGEDHLELFSVPTCEYKEPVKAQIWIDGPNRTITVVQPSEQQDQRRASLFATSVNPFANGGSPRPTTSEARLRAALRQRLPTAQRAASAPAISKAKELVIQAVLARWKIVMIETATAQRRNTMGW